MYKIYIGTSFTVFHYIIIHIIYSQHFVINLIFKLSTNI